MGPKVNARNVQGNKALLTALTRGNLDCVKMLVQAGATLNSSSGEGVDSLTGDDHTALMIASQNGHVDCLQFLLSSGADVNIHNTSQETALTLAASSGQAECIDCLVEAGADINWRNKQGKTPLMLAVRAKALRQGRKGKTACDEQNVLCVERLLMNEADMNIRDLTGKTALMHATMTVGRDSTEDAKYLITDLLLERGADVNVQDNDGMSVLMRAARRNLHYMFFQLISSGADLELTDNRGQTLLVHVLQKWHSGKCRQFLLPLLKQNVNPRLSPEFRPLLQGVIPCLDLKYLGVSVLDYIRLSVCNGFTDFRLGTSNLSWNIEKNPLLSPLANVLSVNILSAIERYMIASCFVFQKDFQVLRRMEVFETLDMDSRQFVQEAGSQPWPLVKLSLITVSSLIGQSPGREDRIRQTGLPWPIQDCLSFQRPISCLPVHHWKDIPLCFNPTEYDRLPAPYPLLYNWPFGRRLVKCDCIKCMGIGLNFSE